MCDGLRQTGDPPSACLHPSAFVFGDRLQFKTAPYDRMDGVVPPNRLEEPLWPSV